MPHLPAFSTKPVLRQCTSDCSRDVSSSPVPFPPKTPQNLLTSHFSPILRALPRRLASPLTAASHPPPSNPHHPLVLPPRLDLHRHHTHLRDVLAAHRLPAHVRIWLRGEPHLRTGGLGDFRRGSSITTAWAAWPWGRGTRIITRQTWGVLWAAVDALRYMSVNGYATATFGIFHGENQVGKGVLGIT